MIVCGITNCHQVTSHFCNIYGIILPLNNIFIEGLNDKCYLSLNVTPFLKVKITFIPNQTGQKVIPLYT